MADRRLLLATTSSGKLREWQALLADVPLQLVTLPEQGIHLDVDETGSTFVENALLKAEAYGTASGVLTLAEDSGLCVSALDGAPGVHSARWEGQDCAKAFPINQTADAGVTTVRAVNSCWAVNGYKSAMCAPADPNSVAALSNRFVGKDRLERLCLNYLREV